MSSIVHVLYRSPFPERRAPASPFPRPLFPLAAPSKALTMKKIVCVFVFDAFFLLCRLDVSREFCQRVFYCRLLRRIRGEHACQKCLQRWKKKKKTCVRCRKFQNCLVQNTSHFANLSFSTFEMKETSSLSCSSMIRTEVIKAGTMSNSSSQQTTSQLEYCSFHRLFEISFRFHEN